MTIKFEDLWKFICYDYSDLDKEIVTYLKVNKIGRKVKEAFCNYANPIYIKHIEELFDVSLTFIDNNRDDSKYEPYADPGDLFDSMEFKINGTNMQMIYGKDACCWFDEVLDDMPDCVESLYDLDIDIDECDFNNLAKQIFNCFPMWEFPEEDMYIEFLVTFEDVRKEDKDTFITIMSKITNTRVGNIGFKGDDDWYSFKKTQSMLDL